MTRTPGAAVLAEVAGAWERITAVPVTLHHLDDALGTVGALHMAQAVIAPSIEKMDPVT